MKPPTHSRPCTPRGRNLNSTSPDASHFSVHHPAHVDHGSTLHLVRYGIACLTPIRSCGFALPLIVQSSQAKSRRASRTLNRLSIKSPPSVSSMDHSPPTKSRHIALHRSGSSSTLGYPPGPMTADLIFCRMFRKGERRH